MKLSALGIQAIPARLAPLIGKASFRLVRIEGQDRETGSTLSAVYLGSDDNLEFLRSHFFRSSQWEEVASRGLPIITGGSIRRWWRDSHLQLTDLPPLWRCFQRTDCDLVVPAWVAQKLVLPPLQHSERLWPLPRSLAREGERHIRRSDYSLVITDQPAEFEAFYDDLYLPYIRARFGSSAVVVERNRFLASAHGQHLALLRRSNAAVAGMLVKRRGSAMRFGWFGAATCPPPSGASEALDALVLRQAWLDGVKTVHFGNSRPVVTNGVFRYKARFGAVPVATRFPQARLGIGFPQSHAGVTAILAHHRLIVPA